MTPEFRDFRPVAPGWNIVIDQREPQPLVGWVWHDDRWHPAFWNDNDLQHVALDEAEHKKERVRVVPATDV